MGDHFTRRAAMAALTAGTAGTAIAVIVPAAAAGAAPTDRTAWTRAVVQYRALNGAFSAANDASDDAQGVYFERQPKRPTFVMEVEGDYGRFGKHTLPITIHHDELDDPNRQWADPAQIEQFRRELSEYRTADAELRRELRMNQLEDATSKALEGQSEALRALIATPAPDLAALIEKMEITLAEYDDEGDATSTVLADLRRLAKQEG